MTRLSKATGARTVTNLDDFSVKDLGFSKLVEERKVEQDKWVFIEGCKNPKAVTILVRGDLKGSWTKQKEVFMTRSWL